MWDYDIYWVIPSFAPEGSFSVEVRIRGHIDEDQDDHFETLSKKSGDGSTRGKHKVFKSEDLPEDTLACLMLFFTLER